jgi:AcrR family transcriptional regulator
LREEVNISKRRQDLKSALVEVAERALARHGLAAVRARDLAAEVGCAVGAIYNVFADLDELVMVVNARTLQTLERDLKAIPAASERGGPAEAVDHLVRLADAYLDFALTHTERWRAVFEHRMPPGKQMPGWYLDEQMRLFGYVEQPLRLLLPQLDEHTRALVARSLVSAVHGVVSLGLEEKLQTLPVETLREQVALLVTAIGRGLAVGPAGARR